VPSPGRGRVLDPPLRLKTNHHSLHGQAQKLNCAAPPIFDGTRGRSPRIKRQTPLKFRAPETLEPKQGCVPRNGGPGAGQHMKRGGHAEVSSCPPPAIFKVNWLEEPREGGLGHGSFAALQRNSPRRAKHPLSRLRQQLPHKRGSRADEGIGPYANHEPRKINGASPTLWEDQGYSQHLRCNDCKLQ